MSARYTPMKDHWWIPKAEDFRTQSKDNKQGSEGSLEPQAGAIAHVLVSDASKYSGAVYSRLLEVGVGKEQARTVLPMGQYTEAYVTATLGDWLLFLRQRLDHHAQYEIRVYAEAVAEILSQLFPETMKAFYEYQLASTTFSATEMDIIKDILAGKSFDLWHAGTVAPDPYYELIAPDVGGMYGEHLWCKYRTIYDLPQEERQEYLESRGLTNKSERIEFWKKIT